MSIYSEEKALDRELAEMTPGEAFGPSLQPSAAGPVPGPLSGEAAMGDAWYRRRWAEAEAKIDEMAMQYAVALDDLRRRDAEIEALQAELAAVREDLSRATLPVARVVRGDRAEDFTALTDRLGAMVRAVRDAAGVHDARVVAAVDADGAVIWQVGTMEKSGGALRMHTARSYPEACTQALGAIENLRVLRGRLARVRN